MDIIRGIIGMGVIIGIAYLLSNNKKHINWRLVGTGLGIQFVLAVFILKATWLSNVWSPLGWPSAFFSWVSKFFVVVIDFTTEGAFFIFDRLAYGPAIETSMGFFFAFQVLPTIIFFASLTSLLYHFGILQWIVSVMAKFMQKALGTSGAESLSVTANIFVGQTEAPLVIKPYIEKMTKSELLAVMTGGMATIAGGVMAAYIQILGGAYAVANGIPVDEAELLFAEQLLGASLMAAPAALVIAKILHPEVEEPATKGSVSIEVEKKDANGIDAAASGASEGLTLALNVGAMLLAFVALIAMFNWVLGWIGDITTLHAAAPNFRLSIESLLGYTFAPPAWLIGVPASDMVAVGSLLGTKLVLTEFIAYSDLSSMIGDGTLSPKTIAMSAFALCGFANFSSIAIQIGGIGGLAPSRKADLAKFGLKAVFAGTMANLMTATIAGMLF